MRHKVRHRRINICTIGRRAPLDATQRSTLADASLPQDRALPVGIERMHDTGFLTRNQGLTPVRKINQNRRRTEVRIRTVVFRAIDLIRNAAAEIEGVAGSDLTCPENSP